jgi:L-arabinose isomerase
VEWTVKLEAKFGWGELRSFEVGRLSRRVQALTADEIGLMLDEAKTLLVELQRHMVESQIELVVPSLFTPPSALFA